MHLDGPADLLSRKMVYKRSLDGRCRLVITIFPTIGPRAVPVCFPTTSAAIRGAYWTQVRLDRPEIEWSKEATRPSPYFFAR